MKFTNIGVFNFEGAIRGMRNPKESWHLMDSKFHSGLKADLAKQVANSVWCAAHKDADKSLLMDKFYPDSEEYWHNAVIKEPPYDRSDSFSVFALGPQDLRLASTLVSGGSEHRKFLRQIFVTVDITAPLYWWKEFDTYKVGTTANSTSTMHTLHKHELSLDAQLFEMGDYHSLCELGFQPDVFIEQLELLRQKYIEDPSSEDGKRAWKELIRWLPCGWLQTRTVTLNYENLLLIYHQRKHHKLVEWSGSKESFCSMVRTLPYAKTLLQVETQKVN